MAKSTNINNRRYLGNKYKLLPFIKKVVDSECTDIEIVVDIFSGTGAVASAFQDKQLITNDILYSNYISNFAWFSPRKYSRKKIETIIDEYNAMVINEENYMTINFSNTYFSHDDCSKIGYIREDIETKYANKEINERERALLITSLLYAMDKIAKTCGHYDAYRQGVEFDMHLELLLPEASITNNKKNKCYNIDSNDLAVPYLHVFLDNTWNLKNCAFIRLDKPEYVPEKNSKRLSTKQKEELIYILTRECNGNWIASIIDKSNIKAATGYETAVQTWIDTYEGNNKIQYDKNGFLVMPDYTKL